MARLLARIGGFSARHRWFVLLAWILILVIMVGGAATLSKPLNSNFDIAGLSSVSTLDKIDREFRRPANGGGNVVFAAPRGRRLTAADAATVGAMSRAIATVPGVASPPRQTLAPDGRIGFLAVTLTGQGVASSSVQNGISAAIDAARQSGLQVEESSGLSSSASASNPLVGLVIAFIILFVTFGSLLAAGFPLLNALLGLGVGIGGIYAVTAFTPLNSVAPTLALLLSLAVGIDYALFIVNRHRRQLLEGMAVRESIALAVGTAGSAVIFAALTVVIALAGLAVMRVGFLTEMGFSAAAAVLIAMLISITLTPALLSMAGPRVLGRRARRRLAAGTQKPAGHVARRWVMLTTRFPVLPLVASVVVLGMLAMPVLGMRLGLPNDGSEPGASTVRKAYDLMAEGFGKGVNGPILVLTHASSVPAIGATKNVARVTAAGQVGGDVLLTVYPDSGPSDAATTALVHTLRERPGLEVTGETAIAIDVSQRLESSLPLYLGLVVGFAFLLLLVAFRSVLIPLKATLSFLLSLGATLGCTVAVFQWGWLGRVFGVDPAGPLLSFLPILVIGVLFGLSMDYEMFLVTGMREEHAHGAEAHDAVVTGFGQGARVVTAAALIMIGVFGNGVFAGDNTIKPIAFGLAVGVLVDAFVVRMTLVPAAMTLFGRAAWWFPRRLDRVTPRVDLEGTALRRPPAPLAAAIPLADARVGRR